MGRMEGESQLRAHLPPGIHRGPRRCGLNVRQILFMDEGEKAEEAYQRNIRFLRGGVAALGGEGCPCPSLLQAGLPT